MGTSEQFPVLAFAAFKSFFPWLKSCVQNLSEKDVIAKRDTPAAWLLAFRDVRGHHRHMIVHCEYYPSGTVLITIAFYTSAFPAVLPHTKQA